MNKIKKLLVVTFCLSMVISGLVACGKKLNGTFTYDYVMKTEYGEETLELPTYMQLTINGDSYDMISTVDIGGGFSMSIGYEGKCTIDGNQVTCLEPDKYYSYESTIEDGKPQVNMDTKAESEPQEGVDTSTKTYEVDTEAGTFAPVE